MAKELPFIYVVYIRTTPERLWEALTNPEFTRQYWGGLSTVSDWKKGATWQLVARDENDDIYVVGEVLERVPPKRLVLTWADPDDTADRSRVTFEIEPIGEMVRLNVIHGDFTAGSDMKGKISGGWPRVLSSLKSYLETGMAFDIKCH